MAGLGCSPRLSRKRTKLPKIFRELVLKYPPLGSRRFDLNGPVSPDVLLGLVTQALLVPVELHALAALVLGNFGFTFLFNGSHRAVFGSGLLA